jgi:hypothetical protein
MKKIMTPLLVVISFMASAQFNKGDKFIGGTFQFRSTKQSPLNFYGETIKTSSASITPYFGFLLSPHLAIGGGVGYSSTHSKITENFFLTNVKQRTVSCDVFVKRFFSLSDKFLFSLKGDIRYAAVWEKYSSKGWDETDSPGDFSAIITPSFIFLPKPNWGIEASIGGVSATVTGSSDYDFSVNFNTFSFGVNYFFRK